MQKTLSLPIQYQVFSHKDDRYMKIRIHVMHDGPNLNGSVFTKEAMEAAKESIVNIPILAFVRQQDGTDNADFGGHEIEFKFTDDGIEFVYLGRPIGVIPETGNDYHYEERDGRTYVVVDGYVWTNYANKALDILKRDGVKGQSMEVAIDDYEYDENTDEFIIKKYRYMGLCLLGDDVQPAMKGAKAELIGNFSAVNALKEFSMKVEELNKSLQQKAGTGYKNKGGKINMMTAEDVLKKYSITKEELEKQGIDFQKYENDPEALEVKLYSMKLEKDLEDAQTKLEAYERETQKLQGKLDELEKTHEELKAEFEAQKAELEKLRDYKESVERAKHEAEAEKLFAKFTDLSELDIADLRKNVHNYTIEQLERELLVICGQKALQAQKNKTKKEKGTPDLTFSLDVQENDKYIPGDYDDLFKQYLK